MANITAAATSSMSCSKMIRSGSPCTTRAAAVNHRGGACWPTLPALIRGAGRSRLLMQRAGQQVRCNSADNKEPGHGTGSNAPVADAPAPIGSIGKSVQESVEGVTKQSFLGARPSSTTPWPRPEVERRPETGDRSFGSLFAFDGAAPETINGRMAMLGFVWALVAEKTTGLSVMEQLFNPSTFGLFWFALVVLLFTGASIIPFANGESTDARRWGPFTGRAERWNGRLAMIGFAALLVGEMLRQGPLFR